MCLVSCFFIVEKGRKKGTAKDEDEGSGGEREGGRGGEGKKNNLMLTSSPFSFPPFIYYLPLFHFSNYLASTHLSLAIHSPLIISLSYIHPTPPTYHPSFIAISFPPILHIFLLSSSCLPYTPYTGLPSTEAAPLCTARRVHPRGEILGSRGMLDEGSEGKGRGERERGEKEIKKEMKREGKVDEFV